MLDHGTSFGFAVTPTLGGSGTVTVTGSMSLGNFSAMSGSGTTVLAAGATGTITGNIPLGRALFIGGQATLSGASINNAGGSVENAGLLLAQGAGSTTTINVPVTNDATGTIEVDGATLRLTGGFTNHGAISTINGGQFIDDGTVGGNASIGEASLIDFGGVSSSHITFAGQSGTLQLDKSQSFTGQISGFGGADQIDLGDIAFDASATTLGYSGNSGNSGGTLSVSDGTHTANLALLGNYMASSFATSSDGHGGTLITDAAQSSIQPPHP